MQDPSPISRLAQSSLRLLSSVRLCSTSDLSKPLRQNIVRQTIVTVTYFITVITEVLILLSSLVSLGEFQTDLMLLMSKIGLIMWLTLHALIKHQDSTANKTPAWFSK